MSYELPGAVGAREEIHDSVNTNPGRKSSTFVRGLTFTDFSGGGCAGGGGGFQVPVEELAGLYQLGAAGVDHNVGAALFGHR